MTADMCFQRVDAIQSMVAQLQPTPASATTTSSSSASFADQLTNATAATPTATTAAATTPVATAAIASGASTGTLDSTVPYAAQITSAAQKYSLDPALLAGLIKQESGFDPTIQSGAGATGLTQLMPGTASSLGVTDVTDPAQSIDGGAHYLREQLDSFGGNVQDALAAYNAGPGAVQQYGGIPPYAETQNYVRSVMANADQYRGVATTT